MLFCRTIASLPNLIRHCKQSLFNFSFSSIMTSSTNHRSNRLIEEKSPYLLQHAYNPIDWYPWGTAAIEKAKQDDKIIFLSVGYSTCHWCHVMEKESFENQSISEIMNRNFINVKVDREERPDVDKTYMEFVQATTGSGGWPMSVWLTPDLKPLVGGTYFPPENVGRRTGFKTILEHIANKWRSDRPSLIRQGDQIAEILSQQASSTASGDTSITAHAIQCSTKCFNYFEGTYDHEYGGFGEAPKFPQASIFEFLLRYYEYRQDANGHENSTSIKMVTETLKYMWNGGIHDHVTQGFHRYSTDQKWHVPHFEKMLYDQAQLALTVSQVFKITKNKFFVDYIRDILTYVERDLSHESGGFYSAEDADSVPLNSTNLDEKREGAFCTWTYHEIQNLLNQPVHNKTNKSITVADVFCEYYTVQQDGNVDPDSDIHGELTGQNVLINFRSKSALADHFKISEASLTDLLEKGRKILFTERLKRPKPHLDSKMITGWNALMASGFFAAASALNDKNLAERGQKCLDFVKDNLYCKETGKLLRCCYLDSEKQISQIENSIEAFSDDYAYLIRALLDAYAFSFDEKLIEFAETLQEKMNELFWNNSNQSNPVGAYYQCSNTSLVPYRLIHDSDGAEPSANSVAILNSINLYNLTHDEKYKKKAEQILAFFGERFKKFPYVLPMGMCGLMAYNVPATQVVIIGEEALEETQKMLKIVRQVFLPFGCAILLNKQSSSYLTTRNEHLKKLVESATDFSIKPTVFVCSGFSCKKPVHLAADLEKILVDKK